MSHAAKGAVSIARKVSSLDKYAAGDRDVYFFSVPCFVRNRFHKRGKLWLSRLRVFQKLSESQEGVCIGGGVWTAAAFCWPRPASYFLVMPRSFVIIFLRTFLLPPIFAHNMKPATGRAKAEGRRA